MAVYYILYNGILNNWNIYELIFVWQHIWTADI